jgi:hypothetical protein
LSEWVTAERILSAWRRASETVAEHCKRSTEVPLNGRLGGVACGIGRLTNPFGLRRSGSKVQRRSQTVESVAIGQPGLCRDGLVRNEQIASDSMGAGISGGDRVTLNLIDRIETRHAQIHD